MPPDRWSLYRHMLRSRLFERAVQQLWLDGDISGEMHLGTGEEAIAAGVVSQLIDGDAMALDHRGTPPLLMRGVDPVALLRELLGRPDGLCAGMGGHMHLFSREHLVASSGIVGAGGPAVVGFALAARRLRPGTLAVAFFGEGAVNQGMLLEAMNLATVWQLPALFVCKDNGWAITSKSASLTGGTLAERAHGFGMPVIEIDGTDVEAVWHAAHRAVARARQGDGPTFLHARCVHLEGHFLGDPLIAGVRHPLREMTQMAGPLTRSFLRSGGGSLSQRVGGLRSIMGTLLSSYRDVSDHQDRDPVSRARETLTSEPDRLEELEQDVRQEIERVIETALTP
ncbi:MAG: thiamine pyrophosphate-dependent dehydrogenase E1 component subunit alpha [Chloroflexota bacterium]|nr:thiamine pyrophosphate-dependent dehydrogenase E1 component subunit alpha [Chloroflexota bacterium]